MYKIKNLLDSGLNTKKLNDDVNENISLIKTLSDNFATDNSQAKELDELTVQQIKKEFPEALPEKKVIKVKRKCTVCSKKTITENSEKIADELMKINSKIWDELKIESGSQIKADKKLQKEYIYILLADTKKYKGKIDKKVFEILRDNNEHTLNNILAHSDYYVGISEQWKKLIDLDESSFSSDIKKTKVEKKEPLEPKEEKSDDISECKKVLKEANYEVRQAKVGAKKITTHVKRQDKTIIKDKIETLFATVRKDIKAKQTIGKPTVELVEKIQAKITDIVTGIDRLAQEHKSDALKKIYDLLEQIS